MSVMSQASPAARVSLLPPSLGPWDGTGSEREIAVLMSGGVDSSVAALLLGEAGWKVLGLTMKVPVAPACRHPRPCGGAEAPIVCHTLGVAHYFLDVEEAFETLVIEPFRRAYLEGRTPNPCVDCNTELKLRLAWDLVESAFGVRHLATGHYARVVRAGGRFCLARGADGDRDQSYFLHGIRRGRLAHFHLPLGDRSKAATRRIARERGLPVADRDDSQELCFAGQADYRRALAEQGEEQRGPIVDTGGALLGYHDGIANFTVGQRRGLRVACGRPMYVVRICPRDKSVTIGTREEASRRRVQAREPNVLMPERLRAGQRLRGKLRSYGEPAPCTVAAGPEAAMSVEFDVPQFAPAPGQRLVLYDDEERVVAGGTIVTEEA